MADKQGISPRAVLTTPSLQQLVTLLPTTQKAIGKIHGIARKRLTRYGPDIESIIRSYCAEHQLTHDQTLTGPSTSRKQLAKTVSSTKLISLEMFEAGKSIQQIAAERKLSESTICGHLAHFVEEKVLAIERLLSADQFAEIEAFFAASPKAMLGDAKRHFGDKYSFGELRLAASALDREHV